MNRRNGVLEDWSAGGLENPYLPHPSPTTPILRYSNTPFSS